MSSVDNINTKSKNKEAKLDTPSPTLCLCHGASVTTPTSGVAMSIKGWTPPGHLVQLERNSRPNYYYRNHNATAEWGLYVKCTLNIAMRWAGEEVCDVFINIKKKLLQLIWKTSFLAHIFCLLFLKSFLRTSATHRTSAFKSVGLTFLIQKTRHESTE